MSTHPAPTNVIPTRAAGYVRVSTTDQVREGVSLEAQAERIRSYCISSGLSLGQVFVDAGVSGGTPLSRREQARALLASIATKEVGAVKLDRVFRNTVDCIETCQRWEKAAHRTASD
jgi:site-specific DNA recombinase